MDLHRLAAEFAPPEGRVRIRFGKVVSVQTASITVTVGGSTDTVAGVRYLASMTPVVDAVVILLTDGADLFALGHLAE